MYSKRTAGKQTENISWVRNKALQEQDKKKKQSRADLYITDQI